MKFQHTRLIERTRGPLVHALMVKILTRKVSYSWFRIFVLASSHGGVELQQSNQGSTGKYRVRTHVRTHGVVCVRTCVLTCLRTCFVCVRTCVLCVRKCVRTYVRMHAHVRTQVHTHTHVTHVRTHLRMHVRMCVYRRFFFWKGNKSSNSERH